MVHIIVVKRGETKKYHIHRWYNILCRSNSAVTKQESIRKTIVKWFKKTVDNLYNNRYNSRSRHMMTNEIGLWKLNREIGKE